MLERFAHSVDCERSFHGTLAPHVCCDVAATALRDERTPSCETKYEIIIVINILENKVRQRDGAPVAKGVLNEADKNHEMFLLVHEVELFSAR